MINWSPMKLQFLLHTRRMLLLVPYALTMYELTRKSLWWCNLYFYLCCLSSFISQNPKAHRHFNSKSTLAHTIHSFRLFYFYCCEFFRKHSLVAHVTNGILCSTALYVYFSHVQYITSQPKSTSGVNSFHHNNFLARLYYDVPKNLTTFDAKPFRTDDQRKLIHPGRTLEICCLDLASSTSSRHSKHVCWQHIQCLPRIYMKRVCSCIWYFHYHRGITVVWTYGVGINRDSSQTHRSEDNDVPLLNFESVAHLTTSPRITNEVEPFNACNVGIDRCAVLLIVATIVRKHWLRLKGNIMLRSGSDQCLTLGNVHTYTNRGKRNKLNCTSRSTVFGS